MTLVVSKGAPAPTGVTPDDRDKVRSVCYRWRDAWSAEDLDGYFACYSKSAKIWMKGQWWTYWECYDYEREKFAEGDIQISIPGGISTTDIGDHTIEATFTMNYERYGSNPYSSSGRQSLTMEETQSGNWLIVKDRFERH